MLKKRSVIAEEMFFFSADMFQRITILAWESEKDKNIYIVSLNVPVF